MTSISYSFFKKCLTGIAVWMLVYGHCTAQVGPGFITGRFSGISSANIRPGGIAPSPFKFDATLVGAHLFTQPDNIFRNKDAIRFIFSGGFKELPQFNGLNKDKSLVISGLQGPSFLVSVSKNVALALAWNVRYMWASNLSAPEVVKLFDIETSTLNLNMENESVKVLFNGWNEFALGAGGLVFEKRNHSLSVGGFAKLIFGTANMNIDIANLKIKSTGDNVEEMGLSLNAVMSDQTYTLLDKGSNDFFDQAGFGFDLGVEYKWRNPRACPGGSNYRIKAGIALTDIGRMKFSSTRQYSGVNASAENINLERFRNASTVSATVDSLLEIFNISKATAEDYNATLPMSLRLYLEGTAARRVSLYTEFHFIFTQLMEKNIPLIFQYNLTPRFEDYQVGVYLPMTFSNYIPANVGLALRWKPFIIGSGNLFTFWIYDDRGNAFDLFLTIKVPVVQDDERVDYKAMKKL